ncbi:hypothetical protein MBM_01505 [Drepanopeziza brunnea f. sp. 'multigermtubi' MB_m1]|uniref:Uncharacterized protein n=1 Tax=Marssonina brunnea f. sp. multigermtubi (strain MB_m1) TaxID=1072389 RepID=K1XJF2_MARBU|nr:uncharacterized protein MBM_01505 [Drepanopeziza brunnea f. sp. 'multigermtubi' MB_m1]EKD20823.1 hypothetical protein MBM_01505 [Drepanopeziza brunnea f. sp. 'multigermtubi' MB_m1]
MVSLAFIAALSTFVAIALAKAIAEPITTPAPVFPRQNFGQDMIEYYAYGSGYDSARCRIGSTWTASSTYGRCCPTSLTCAEEYFITKCSGNTAVFGDGYTSSCSGSFSVCNTDQIVQTLSDASPTFWIGYDDMDWRRTTTRRGQQLLRLRLLSPGYQNLLRASSKHPKVNYSARTTTASSGVQSAPDGSDATRLPGACYRSAVLCGTDLPSAYQPLGVQSPVVSRNLTEKNYFPLDKTPAVTTSQVPGPGSNPAYIYPPRPELE